MRLVDWKGRPAAIAGADAVAFLQDSGWTPVDIEEVRKTGVWVSPVSFQRLFPGTPEPPLPGGAEIPPESNTGAVGYSP